MGICPNCGNWVDEGDICNHCGGSGSYSYENDNDNESDSASYISMSESRCNEYSNKAWDYYLEFKEEDALYYINLALDINDRHANNWNKKAIILEGMKRYAESEKCYDKSLELSSNNLVQDNKTRMLYSWAAQLIEESKKLPNGLRKLEEAKEKNFKAMNARPGDNSEENLDKYLTQRDTINHYIDYERKYQRNLEILKAHDKYELFTLTGTNFYENSKKLRSGIPLKLVKEPDNEFDNDAIAVYLGDEKVGYVANKEYTKYELTSSASELQDKIPNVIQGEYLFHLNRYSAIQFEIGRIIK
ncbi:MAG: HIRAN domain-containing protein [Methanobrevibacter sp.]|nr:HIRAN domain-containing protein [Methanobrevibacter sp.]